MTVAYASAGTLGNGTSSVSVTLPGTTDPGNLLVAVVSSKYTDPDTPAGWTLLRRATGGSGPAGVDTGDATCSVYGRICVGTEAGSSVTWNSVAGDSMLAAVYRYSKDTRASWDIAVSAGLDTAPGTAWSVTGDVALDFAAGDMAIACSAINADTYGYSSQALSASGATFANMVERRDAGSTNGDDLALSYADFDVSAGAGPAVPTFTMTASASAANAPAGATVVVRIREVLTAPILWNNKTTIQPGSTTINVTVPGGIAAGEPLVLTVCGKYPTNYPTTPSGWTFAGVARTNTGIGAGVDTGDVFCAAYYRIATGTESTFTLLIPSGNSVSVSVHRCLITSGYGVSVAAQAASMDTPGTAVALTWADPGIQKDDLLFAITCHNTDAATVSTVPLWGVPGAIVPNINRESSAQSTGDDHRHVVYTGPVNNTGSGGSVGYTYTAGASCAVAGLLVRLRGVPPVTYRRDHSYSNGIARGIARGVN